MCTQRIDSELLLKIVWFQWIDSELSFNIYCHFWITNLNFMAKTNIVFLIKLCFLIENSKQQNNIVILIKIVFFNWKFKAAKVRLYLIKKKTIRETIGHCLPSKPNPYADVLVRCANACLDYIHRNNPLRLCY